MKRFNLFAFLLLLVVSQCSKENEEDKNAIKLPDGNGFEYLSEYNFFEGDLYNLTPNSDAGVLPYDLNMPLFSDYALKKRFVFVPKGVSAPFKFSNWICFN